MSWTGCQVTTTLFVMGEPIFLDETSSDAYASATTEIDHVNYFQAAGGLSSSQGQPRLETQRQTRHNAPTRSCAHAQHKAQAHRNKHSRWKKNLRVGLWI